jgi:hypothetical protein
MDHLMNMVVPAQTKSPAPGQYAVCDKDAPAGNAGGLAQQSG